MSREALASLLVAALAQPAAGAPPAMPHSPPPEWVSDARAAGQQLGSRLIAALNTALADGGPVAAVEVCRIQAPAIQEAASSARVRIGRTALRVRNPDNQPDDWERSVLERFRQAVADGADPATLEVWAEQQLNGRRVGRWMKAIPTAPLCTTCHGSDLPPELREVIAEHYPADQATGFRVGELRGAFSARIMLDTPRPGSD
ncbi:MAG: DUF3365 domain-containing protein [Wenzhouxiangellaceae bacterium]